MFSATVFSNTLFEENRDLQLEARYANLERIAKPLNVTAETMIEYIAEIGGDTTELESIHSAFQSKVNSVRNQKTHIELNELVVDAAQDIKDFGKEYKAQFDAHEGKPLVSLARIVEALSEAKEEIDELTEIYWETRQTNVLQIFDNDVEAAEELLPLFVNHPNYEAITAKVNEIKEMRNDLETALESRKELQILDVQTDIWLMVQELGNLIKNK
jgi:hypothetical protein